MRRRRQALVILAGLALVVAGCTARVAPLPDGKAAAAPAKEIPYRYQPPSAVDDGWATASLESAGFDRRRIEQMTDVIRRSDWNIHAVLIERDGRLVYEEYFAGEDQRWGRPLGRVSFDRHTLHDLRSVSKSVVSALVGIAVASGSIRSVDEPILRFFPEHADVAASGWRGLTLRHALTMSAGIEWNEELPYTDPRNDEFAMTRSPDPIAYVLKRPVVVEPGQRWNYNGGLTQVLAVIVQRATGRPLSEYAAASLFEPLGIREVEWLGDLDGVPAAASGLRLRARDLAKFGSLYLHDGQWRGRQIVPSQWVSESTRRHLPLPTRGGGSVESRGYGYQWWHACYRIGADTVETPAAVGNGQQRIYVLPGLRMVVTILAGRYNDRTATRLAETLLVEHVIPSAISAQSGSMPTPAGCRNA